MDIAISFFREIGFGLLAFALFITFDVSLAVGIAIHRKTFDWDFLGDFYFTMILPYLIPWFVLSTIVKLFFLLLPELTDQLGPDAASILTTASIGVLWLFAVSRVVTSVKDHLSDLYGEFILKKPPVVELEPDLADDYPEGR